MKFNNFLADKSIYATHGPMLFVLIGCVLLSLKLFQVEPFAYISWWWIVIPLVIAVLWFEVIEPFFGLDIRREKKEYERMSKRFLQPVRPNKAKTGKDSSKSNPPKPPDNRTRGR